MNILPRVKWIVFGFLAIGVGMYPILYLLTNEPIGLLSGKSPELLSNTLWNIGFFAHILPGGIALLVGWTQFSIWLRNKYLRIHRVLGKTYVLAVLISGLAGFGIAWHATGGIIAMLGFAELAIFWVSTTLAAYISIRRGDVTGHEKWMIYSYALCFAAVTLRVYLPILVPMTGDFISAYRIVAWLCWVPNLIFAYVYTDMVKGNRVKGLRA